MSPVVAGDVTHGNDMRGAEISVHGAEAVLKLRAVRANDRDAYWRHHLERERQPVHQSR